MKRTLLSLLVMAATAHVSAQGVTDAMIANDAATPDNVLSWGLGTQGQRHSTLTGINAKNINKLVPVWSMSFGGEKQRGQQSQPLVHNGKMFVTASYSRIYAVDSKTGKKLWKYEHRLPEGIMPCCDVINRGAALYDDLVIFGTLDAQIVALNRDTGKVVWREKVDDYKAGYSMTAAPQIVKGMVITGVSGGEFGVIGRVEARDAKTGAMVKGTVKGQFVIALCQGVAGAISIYIAGFHNGFFVFAILLTALSVIPLGGGIVTIPFGIGMMFFGNVIGGIFVVVFHLVVVTNIDNALRPWLVPKAARLDPALMLLAVFAGISMFGFFGIVIGPVLMIIIVTTVMVYLAVYKGVELETDETDTPGPNPWRRMWGSIQKRLGRKTEAPATESETETEPEAKPSDAG